MNAINANLSTLTNTAPTLTITATVTASLGDGEYHVKVGKNEVTLKSSQELQVNQEVQLKNHNGAWELVNAENADKLLPENSPAPKVIPENENSDSATTTIRVTVSLKEFIKIASEQSLANAKIEFVDGKVVIEFDGGKTINAQTPPNSPLITSATSALSENLSTALNNNMRGGSFTITDLRLPAQLLLNNNEFLATLTLPPTQNLATLLSTTPTISTATKNIADSAPINLPITILAVKEQIVFAQINSQNIKIELPAPALTLITAQLNEQKTPLLLNLTLPETIDLRGKLSSVNNAPLPPPLDKFILLAGLTPSEATREVAQVLLNENLPIDRRNVQTLLSLVAGRSGEERLNLLSAGARLLRSDTPLSMPIVAGNAQVNDTEIKLSDKIYRAQENLKQVEQILRGTNTSPISPTPTLPTVTSLMPTPTIISPPSDLQNLPMTNLTPEITNEISKNLSAALSELENLSVFIDEPQLPEKLQNAFTTLARTSLARAETQIENATTLLLRNNPDLQKLDVALQEILSRLDNTPENNAPKNRGNLLTPEEQNDPPPAKITSESKNEKTITNDKKIVNEENAPIDDKNLPAAKKIIITTPTINEKFIDVLPEKFSEPIMRKFTDSHPGVRDFPSAWKEVATPNPPNVSRLESALREIFSANSIEEVTQKTREVVRKLDNETLRALSANLQSVEREEIAAQPALSRLANVASELRDLGRMMVAMKAENLATMHHDPAYMSAILPFKLHDESGDGKLQMYYRKQKNRGPKNWLQRVVLDLDLTALGNVIGDLRFTADKKLSVTIATTEHESNKVLQQDRDELANALSACGFPCTPEFRLILPAHNETKTNASTIIHHGQIDIQV